MISFQSCGLGLALLLGRVWLRLMSLVRSPASGSLACGRLWKLVGRGVACECVGDRSTSLAQGLFDLSCHEVLKSYQLPCISPSDPPMFCFLPHMS
jgi:hypothetical protein